MSTPHYTPPPPSPRILIGDAPTQRQNLRSYITKKRLPITPTTPPHQPYLIRSPFLLSLHTLQKTLRQKRLQSSRSRLNCDLPKDFIGAGLGAVKGVVGTAFGVLGTVVETGATVIKQDQNLPLLPPMTLNSGPMRNIFANNVVSEGLRKHFERLGIKSPFEGERDKSKGGVREKFVPIRSGDVVYLSSTVPGPNRTAISLYLSSIGTQNHQLGGLEVQESDEIEDIYWCLFRVWYRESYSDWHVDERRPCFSVGEHGEYALESLNDFVMENHNDEDVGGGEGDNSKTGDGNDEGIVEHMIHGPGGQRCVHVQI